MGELDGQAGVAFGQLAMDRHGLQDGWKHILATPQGCEESGLQPQ